VGLQVEAVAGVDEGRVDQFQPALDAHARGVVRRHTPAPVAGQLDSYPQVGEGFGQAALR